MKILQILPELNVGGVETGTVDFARYLKNNGYESIVVSNGGELVKKLDDIKVAHYKLPVHKKSLFTILKCIKALRKIIIEENVSIVHARSRVPAWIAFFACRKTNASFITTCHGYYKSPLTSRVMGWSKLVIVISNIIGRHMVEHFHVPPENIRCIPRSVDLDRFKYKHKQKDKSDAPVIAIVGRITPLKGHEFFIKAMAHVVRMMPYVKIWIIGDAPKSKQAYKQQLEMLVKRLGLSENVEFLGNRSDVHKLLTEVDVLVMSTVTQEAFGRVIVEAQAVDVPVVATRVGGVTDIIEHEQTGLLVMPRDPENMAKAVLRLINDEELSKRIVRKAKEQLKNKYTLKHQSEATLQVYNELLEKMHILIIKLSSIGDVVLTTAAIKAIRKKFPKAQIDCLVGNDSLKILQGCPHIDKLIAFDSQDKSLWSALRISHKLRKNKYDKVVDLQNNKKSHLIAFLSFARESYGFSNGKWSFLLSNPLKKYRKNIPAVEHQFQVLRMLGIPYKEGAVSLDLWIPKRDQKRAESLLESEWLAAHHRVVGINIAASEKWATKNWPVEHIARLCDMLSAKNIRVVITGMKKDQERVRKLLSLTKSKPSNFVGKTNILELAAIIKRCSVFLTPDSAPLHLAAAVKTPTVAFFGPTDSNRHMPPIKNCTVMEKKLQCAPCYSTKCKILTHACMQDIIPQDVFVEIEKLMEECV